MGDRVTCTLTIRGPISEEVQDLIDLEEPSMIFGQEIYRVGD